MQNAPKNLDMGTILAMQCYETALKPILQYLPNPFNLTHIAADAQVRRIQHSLISVVLIFQIAMTTSPCKFFSAILWILGGFVNRGSTLMLYGHPGPRYVFISKHRASKFLLCPVVLPEISVMFQS